MAAGQTAKRAAHNALVAATAFEFNLTNAGQGQVEIVHQGDATQVAYFTTASTEAKLVTAVAAADETQVILPGERLTINRPRGGDFWLSIISAGTPTISVIAV